MLTDGSAYYQLQEEMRHAFEGMVVDLPRNMLVQYPHLLNDCHVVVVVTEFTLAGTRDTIRILSWLKSNAPQARIILVANKTSASQEVSRKDFEHSVERKVDVVIPFDSKSATQAAKLGQPLAKANKSPKLSQPLVQLLNLSLEQASSDSTSEEEFAGGSLLSKLGNFKSLVTKKSKEPVAKAA